jgi:hypothetical protein
MANEFAKEDSERAGKRRELKAADELQNSSYTRACAVRGGSLVYGFDFVLTERSARSKG